MFFLAAPNIRTVVGACGEAPSGHAKHGRFPSDDDARLDKSPSAGCGFTEKALDSREWLKFVRWLNLVHSECD